MAKIAQILVAAGKGARFGGEMPKQYRPIGGKPLIRHTLDAVMAAPVKWSDIVIVVAKEDGYISSVIDGITPNPTIVIGGASRTQSVRNGLKALKTDPPDYVLIHDAARPFVLGRIFDELIKALEIEDAAVPILPVTDALKSFAGVQVGSDIDRSSVRAVQTPQAFHYSAIVSAYETLSEVDMLADDIAVAQKAGLSIMAIEGDPNNFKLTYPVDQERAEYMISRKQGEAYYKAGYMATGQGFDVHRLERGETMWLCGVEIKAGLTLRGHSDADVGLHALTDAILGALADGDIGDHFPPSDPQWKGASSDRFLDFAVKRVQKRRGEICHVDMTIICEKPKVKPHRRAMRERLSQLLDMPLDRISVKATTTERLGFTGRGEGIAVQAIATLRLPHRDLAEQSMSDD